MQFIFVLLLRLSIGYHSDKMQKSELGEYFICFFNCPEHGAKHGPLYIQTRRLLDFQLPSVARGSSRNHFWSRSPPPAFSKFVVNVIVTHTSIVSITQHQHCLASTLLSISIAQHQHCLASAQQSLNYSLTRQRRSEQHVQSCLKV